MFMANLAVLKSLVLQVAVFLVALFGLVPVVCVAGDCAVLEFVEKKSSATRLLVNPCLNQHRVGVGSIFQLMPNGRLWLKSGADYQLICRNRSEKTHDVSVTDAVFPWITPTGFGHCSQWTGSTLTCADSENGDELLFCAIVPMKTPLVPDRIKQKTSVSVRGLGKHLKNKASSEVAAVEPDEVKDIIKAEIELCRSAYHNRQSLAVEWTVYASGLVSEPIIKGPVTDIDFTACVNDVITGFDYPSFTKDIKTILEF